MEDIDKIELSYQLLYNLVGLNPFNNELKSGIFSGFWGTLFSFDDNNYLNQNDFNKIFYGLIQDIEQLINEKINDEIIIFLNNNLNSLKENGNNLCDLLKIWEIRNVGNQTIKSIITNYNSKTINFQEFSKLSNENLKLNIRNYYSKLIILLNKFNDFYFKPVSSLLQSSSSSSSLSSSLTSSTFLKQNLKLSTLNMSIYSCLKIDYINNGNEWGFSIDSKKKKQLQQNEFHNEIIKFQNNFGFSFFQLLSNTNEYNIYKVKTTINNTLKNVSRFNELDYLNYKYPIKIICAKKDEKTNENNLIINNFNEELYIFKIQPKSLMFCINNYNNNNNTTTNVNNNNNQDELIDQVSGLIPFYSSINKNEILKTSISLKGEKQFNQISILIHCSNDFKLNEININNNNNCLEIESELSFLLFINSTYSKTNQTKSFLEKVNIKELKMDSLNNGILNSNSFSNNKNKMYYGTKKYDINPGFQMDKIIFEIKDIKGDIVIDNIEISFHFDKPVSFPEC
ncbi:hypothetical protein ACTFIR_010207 [Dictyostelium discoideum]